MYAHRFTGTVRFTIAAIAGVGSLDGIEQYLAIVVLRCGKLNREEEKGTRNKRFMAVCLVFCLRDYKYFYPANNPRG